MGTAAHATTQAFLGYKRVLWGSWECKHCGKRWLNQLGPGVICCGDLPDYIEYSVIHPDKRIGVDGEYGHLDGIIPMPWGMDYVVIDFKTASIRIAEDKKKNGPAESHRMQTSVYGEFCNAGLARVRQRGLPTPDNFRGEILWEAEAVLPPGRCIGGTVIYIPRDSPRMKNWVVLTRPLLKGLKRDLERSVPKTRKKTRKGILPEPRCSCRQDARNEFWRWCPWTEVCFSPDPEAIAKVLYRRYREARRRGKRK